MIVSSIDGQFVSDWHYIFNLGSSPFSMDKMIFNSRPHWFL